MKTTTQQIEVIILDDDDDAQVLPQQIFTAQEVTAYIKNESDTAQAVCRALMRLVKSILVNTFLQDTFAGLVPRQAKQELGLKEETYGTPPLLSLHFGAYTDSLQTF